jgi:hypothetical protein
MRPRYGAPRLLDQLIKRARSTALWKRWSSPPRLGRAGVAPKGRIVTTDRIIEYLVPVQPPKCGGLLDRLIAAQGNRPCYNPGMPNEVVFLKLGGSLITDKSRARAARPETIRHLADKITQARKAALSCSLSLTEVWILRAYRRKTRTLGEEIAEE